MRISGVVLAGILATVVTPCAAQDGAFAGWQYAHLGEGLESYTATGSSALVMLADVDATQFAGGDEGAIIARMSATVEQMCPGLTVAAGSPSRDGRFARATTNAPGVTCVALVVQGTAGPQGAIILATPAALSGAEGKTRQVLARRAGKAATGPSQPPGNLAPPITPVQGSAGLLEMLDNVPVAARPVVMVGRESWASGFGGFPYFKVIPWALFANGVAISGKCGGWNPMAGPPQLGSAAKDCDTARWSKTAAGYVFVDDDGDASEPQDSIATPFQRGERVEVLLEHSSTSGSGVSTDFSVGSSVTWQGRLQLTRTGEFRGSASSAAFASGAGLYAGSGREDPVIKGTYALHGFLIAIQDDSGRVAVKPIGRKVEDGRTYAYFEGDLYWPDD